MTSAIGSLGYETVNSAQLEDIDGSKEICCVEEGLWGISIPRSFYIDSSAVLKSCCGIAGRRNLLEKDRILDADLTSSISSPPSVTHSRNTTYHKQNLLQLGNLPDRRHGCKISHPASFHSLER